MIKVQYIGPLPLVHPSGEWEPKEVKEVDDMVAQYLLAERPGDMITAKTTPKAKSVPKAKLKPAGGVENE